MPKRHNKIHAKRRLFSLSTFFSAERKFHCGKNPGPHLRTTDFPTVDHALLILHSKCCDDGEVVGWWESIPQSSVHLEVDEFQRSAPKNPVNVSMNHPMAEG